MPLSEDGEGSPRPPIWAGQPARLRDLGYDEIWLQNWLAEDPSRLGLGDINVIAQELTHSGGGSLDILAADGDTYFSIEVQLGEVDASHGFRVFDYWARNQDRYVGKTHVAVLVAESAAGRYRAALDAIAEYLPLIVVELRAWRGETEAVVVAEIALANESLDLGAGGAAGTVRTEEEWRNEVTPEAWQLHSDFAAMASERYGEVRVDYSPKSYIGIRRGRRVWAPLWLLQDGARTYLPDPDLSREDEPSLAFEHFASDLREHGVELYWAPKYNAGSNPVSLVIRRSDLEIQAVLDFLGATWRALNPDARPWSEAHPVAESPKMEPAN